MDVKEEKIYSSIKITVKKRKSKSPKFSVRLLVKFYRSKLLQDVTRSMAMNIGHAVHYSQFPVK